MAGICEQLPTRFSMFQLWKHRKALEIYWIEGMRFAFWFFSPNWCQCIAIWLRGNQVKSLQWLCRVLCQMFPTLLQGRQCHRKLSPGELFPLKSRICWQLKRRCEAKKPQKTSKIPAASVEVNCYSNLLRFLFSTLIQRRLFIECYLHFRLWYNFILGCHEKTRRAINGINEWASQLTMLWRFAMCWVIDRLLFAQSFRQLSLYPSNLVFRSSTSLLRFLMSFLTASDLRMVDNRNECS